MIWGGIMNRIEFSLTPNNTCRLFIYNGILVNNPSLTTLLDSLSIWGGADWHNDTHSTFGNEDPYTSWEFKLEYADDLKKFADQYSR
jgi:hypothetical protein